MAQRGGDIKCCRCVFFPFRFLFRCVYGLGKVQLIKNYRRNIRLNKRHTQQQHRESVHFQCVITSGWRTCGAISNVNTNQHTNDKSV